MKPHDLLKKAVEAQERHLTEAGDLLDPIFGVPTQYGTPYHAFCQAVLATLAPQGAERGRHAALATCGLDAALAHVEDSSAPPVVSHIERATGSTWGINHRDFFWPAILGTYRLLKELDPSAAAPFVKRIAAVPVPEPFRTRPPSNWAMVWLLGEWWRIQEGLSPNGIDEIDRWLAEFFASHILVEQGLYMEPGLPNSYDLFTRVHLAQILASGYDGKWLGAAERLMQTGLDRSLGIQLSDGSLASAHRSTGQTWTDAAQVLFFTLAARWFEGREGIHDARRAAAAFAAARRAYTSLLRWQRPDGTLSPVHNLLPAAWRVGYERYTADAHYSNLALAFLATAILHGFDDARAEEAAGGAAGGAASEAPRRAPAETGDAHANAETGSCRVFIEQAPTHRALVHAGPYSVHVNAAPERAYDALGIADITFGLGRLLHFASPAVHLESSRILTLGMALRAGPGRARVRVLAEQDGKIDGVIRESEAGALAARFSLPACAAPVRTRIKRVLTGAGAPREDGPLTYELSVSASETHGVTITERTPGVGGYKTLLLPYLRDAGTGSTTAVDFIQSEAATTIRFSLGTEAVTVGIEGAAEAVLDLPYGYESRRGLCGLVRVDLRDPAESLTYRLTSTAWQR